MNEEKNINETNFKPEGKNNYSLFSRFSSKNKFYFAAILLLTILLSSFLGIAFGFMGGLFSQKIASRLGLNIINDKITPNLEKETDKQTVIRQESAVIDTVEKASPAVVSIVITKDVSKVRGFFNNPFFWEFFGDEYYKNDNGYETEKKEVGSGSGFIVSADGIIVTNKHVVSDTEAEYTVIDNNDKEYTARVLARHPYLDIALIKIEGKDFPVLDLGDSNNLKVGQMVVAIGNPLGEFANSVSLGIISGLRRNITAGSAFGETEKLNGIIQTDAAINPGNSGGPLLDINGKVIGVNVAVAQGAENIAFAIPVNEIKESVAQVRETGKISTPFLGVRYIILNEQIQKENKLPYAYGALILRGEKITDFAVVPGSPADKAGLLENDIILEVNGEKVTEEKPLSELLSLHRAGEEVTLKVWSKSKEKEIKVVLDEKE